MHTPKYITFIVVGTIALMALSYVGTLAYCVAKGLQPPEPPLGAFKDAGMFVLGALSGLLVNTRSNPSEPMPTQIMNLPNQPVPVENTHD